MPKYSKLPVALVQERNHGDADANLAVIEARVADAAERLRPQVADAGLTLQVDAAGVVPVVADPDRVAQIVTNLVGNAIRATGPGGAITLRVARSAAGDDGMTEVTVADTGEGLAAADLERVFERFYRVLGSTESGSGLGLPIVREIAELHRAKVSLNPNPSGKGTIAQVVFPRSRVAQEEEASRLQIALSRPRPGNFRPPEPLAAGKKAKR